MADSDPSILYHYCSNSTLVGLLKSKQIWLSDPRFMNDSRELRHAGHIFARTVRKVAEDFRQHYIDRGLPEQAFLDWVTDISAKFEGGSLFPKYEQSTPFIFCLSEDGDSLSQWRAYGSGHYCIGFDRITLEQRTRGAIHKIAYKKVEFDPEVSGRIAGFFEGHKQHVYGKQLDMEVRYSGDEDFEQLKLENYFLKIKDDSFRDEREWRLVRHVAPNDESLFFDPSGRYPIPRAKFDIFDTSQSAHEVIKEIVCGPGADRERAEAAFAMITRITGTRPNLRFSKIPFRTS